MRDFGRHPPGDGSPGVIVIAGDVNPRDEACDGGVDEPRGIVAEEGEVERDLLAEVVLHRDGVLLPRHLTGCETSRTIRSILRCALTLEPLVLELQQLHGVVQREEGEKALVLDQLVHVELATPFRFARFQDECDQL